MKKFTLIELLVVIAIIGILMTLLLPSLTQARRSSMFAVCKSNEKQIGLAFITYNTNFNQLPYGENPHQLVSSWEVRLAPFLGVTYTPSYIASNSSEAPINNQVLLCPEDESALPPQGFARSYIVNAWESWYTPSSDYGVFSRDESRKLVELKTETVLLVESHHAQSSFKYQGSSWNSALAQQSDYDDMISYHKNSRYNFLYEDGHVKTNRKQDLMLENKSLMLALE
ncbi:MAG: DUF1559 domain-containing protein [Lentisphaeraceae bacterium]|nr:DUF1559 domain-containing protein [Lentisphaeraceae bacterium]